MVHSVELPDSAILRGATDSSNHAAIVGICIFLSPKSSYLDDRHDCDGHPQLALGGGIQAFE